MNQSPLKTFAFTTALFFILGLVPTRGFSCTVSGLYGIEFGEIIEAEQLKPHYLPADGTAFYYPPRVEIAPFKLLGIEITPKSQRVWNIFVEMYGDKEELVKIIERLMMEINTNHPNLHWDISSNHYLSENEELSISFVMIGAYVNGKPSIELSYICESKVWRAIKFQELRALYTAQ